MFYILLIHSSPDLPKDPIIVKIYTEEFISTFLWKKIAWAEWVAWSVIQYGIFKGFSYFDVFFKSFYATDITSKYKIRVYIYRYFTEGPEYNHCHKSLSFFSRQPFVLWDLNLFVSNTPFLYPLKTSEDLMVFWCFQGEEKGCIGTNGLSKGYAFSTK